jgi:hypothetical protein
MLVTAASAGDPVARGLQTAETQARRIRAQDGGPDHEAAEILAATLSLVADRTRSPDQARAIERVLEGYARQMPEEPEAAVKALLRAYEGLATGDASAATRRPSAFRSTPVSLVIAHAHLRAASAAMRERDLEDGRAHIELARRYHAASPPTGSEAERAISAYLDASDLTAMLADEDGPDRILGRLHAAAHAIGERIARAEDANTRDRGETRPA